MNYHLPNPKTVQLLFNWMQAVFIFFKFVRSVMGLAIIPQEDVAKFSYICCQVVKFQPNLLKKSLDANKLNTVASFLMTI